MINAVIVPYDAIPCSVRVSRVKSTAGPDFAPARMVIMTSTKVAPETLGVASIGVMPSDVPETGGYALVNDAVGRKHP